MVVDANNVSKTYKKSRKKQGFTLNIDHFEVGEGSFAAILGANGSGKTTFIKLILDLLHTDEGEIQLLGKDHKNKEARARVSYLPENFQFPAKFTVRQVLRYFNNIDRSNGSNLDNEINELAKALNVDYLDKKIKDLSKGMRQNAALMNAFLGDKKFFILDEPFNGLDAVKKKRVMEYIFERQQQENISVLITTHILSDIEKTCDKLSLIQDGRIIHSATKDEIHKEFDSVEDYYLHYLDPINA